MAVIVPRFTTGPLVVSEPPLTMMRWLGLITIKPLLLRNAPNPLSGTSTVAAPGPSSSR